MTIEQLIRAHHELALTMGYRDATRGQHLYTYALFRQDMNTLHPGTVKNYQQVANVMTGRIPVPSHWEKTVNELLELAVTGQCQPPTPGPFWSPHPLTRDQRRRVGNRLVLWQTEKEIPNYKLAELAEISLRRLTQLRNGAVATLPTEIDRLAAALGLSRDEFLGT